MISKYKLNEQKKILLNKIYRYNFRIPFNSYSDNKFTSEPSNSWFNIHIDKTTIENNNKINTKFNENYQTNNEIIKCKKIIILPTIEQREILLNWFESYRKMYNKILYFF